MKRQKQIKFAEANNLKELNKSQCMGKCLLIKLAILNNIKATKNKITTPIP